MGEVKSCDEWRPFITMIAIDFAFATVNILLKKVLIKGINPLVFITYRLTVSAIFLAPIGYFFEKNSRPKLTLCILCYLFCSAIVGASLCQYFFLLGILNTSATFACAFINLVPVITFIMALPFRIESVNIKLKSGVAKTAGAVICVGGVLVLTLYKGIPLFNHFNSASASASTKRRDSWAFGSIALVIGTFLWSSWFLIQSKIAKAYPCQFSATAIMSFFGAIQSAILTFSTAKDLSVWAINQNLVIITILYSGMIGSGLCYVGMSWCVKKRGPVFTAAFSPLIQIMAGLVDIPILHEQLYLGSFMGSLIVIIGLYILLWGKSKELHNGDLKIAQQDEEKSEQELQLSAISVPCDSRYPSG